MITVKSFEIHFFSFAGSMRVNLQKKDDNNSIIVKKLSNHMMEAITILKVSMLLALFNDKELSR